MTEAHLPIAAFGGTFLMMVGLTYFFDHEKDIHWVRWLEEKVAQYGHHPRDRGGLRAGADPGVFALCEPVESQSSSARRSTAW
jgi:hypothetical protein